MITTTPTMSPTLKHWTELQNVDEILARSRARYKNSSRSKSLPARKFTSQNNKSRYVRNREPKMPPRKMDAELKDAAQNYVIHLTPSVRENDFGPYVEHEIPATDNDAGYKNLEGRKPQAGKSSTDLHHITAQNIVSQNAAPILIPEKDVLNPATNEDFYSPSQSQSWKSRELRSFLGIENDCRPTRMAEYPQPDTAREASCGCEMFDFGLDEPQSQDHISTALLELECTSIGNVSDPSEISGDVPQILRPGTPLPIELVSSKPMSQAVILEEAETLSPPDNPPNELFIPFRESPRILWSQSPRQQSKLRGYIANIRERHSILYKTYKKPESRPNLVFEYPKEITLTIPTTTSLLVESQSQFVDQGLLMPPPRLYKKKQRQQKLIADSINVKELRLRRLSHMDISDEEFAARRDSIMQNVIVIFGD